MKKTFLVLGIIFIIISMMAFALSGLFRYAGNHTLDGSAGLYAKQRRLMLIANTIGISLLVLGVIFMIVSKNIL